MIVIFDREIWCFCFFAWVFFRIKSYLWKALRSYCFLARQTCVAHENLQPEWVVKRRNHNIRVFLCTTARKSRISGDLALFKKRVAINERMFLLCGKTDFSRVFLTCRNWRSSQYWNLTHDFHRHLSKQNDFLLSTNLYQITEKSIFISLFEAMKSYLTQ